MSKLKFEFQEGLKNACFLTSNTNILQSMQSNLRKLFNVIFTSLLQDSMIRYEKSLFKVYFG